LQARNYVSVKLSVLQARNEIYNHMIFNQRYYVYILTNKSHTVLYTGYTKDLHKRLSQHKNKINDGFTNKYNVNKLVYYETLNSEEAAIKREKQIKAGSRAKKIELINSVNKEWNDISDQMAALFGNVNALR
jgi:putative endonuclease